MPFKVHVQAICLLIAMFFPKTRGPIGAAKSVEMNDTSRTPGTIMALSRRALEKRLQSLINLFPHFD